MLPILEKILWRNAPNFFFFAQGSASVKQGYLDFHVQWRLQLTRLSFVEKKCHLEWSLFPFTMRTYWRCSFEFWFLCRQTNRLFEKNSDSNVSVWWIQFLPFFDSRQTSFWLIRIMTILDRLSPAVSWVPEDCRLLLSDLRNRFHLYRLYRLIPLTNTDQVSLFSDLVTVWLLLTDPISI